MSIRVGTTAGSGIRVSSTTFAAFVVAQEVTGTGTFAAGDLLADFAGDGQSGLVQSVYNIGGGVHRLRAGSLTVAFSGSGVASVEQPQQVTGTGIFARNLAAAFAGDGTATVPTQQVTGTGRFAKALQAGLTGSGASVSTQDGAGRFRLTLVATFTGSGTSVDLIPPVLVSARLEPTGEALILSFSERVQVGSGGSGGFALTASGGAADLSFDSLDGRVLRYVIDRAIEVEETVTLAYTQPDDGIEDLAGNDLASFEDVRVEMEGVMQHNDISLRHNDTSLQHKDKTLVHNNVALRHK